MDKSTQTNTQPWYKCRVCDTIFAPRSSLHRHIASIYGKPRHTCHLCRCIYIYGKALKTHIKSDYPLFEDVTEHNNPTHLVSSSGCPSYSPYKHNPPTATRNHERVNPLPVENRPPVSTSISVDWAEPSLFNIVLKRRSPQSTHQTRHLSYWGSLPLSVSLLNDNLALNIC